MPISIASLLRKYESCFCTVILRLDKKVRRKGKASFSHFIWYMYSLFWADIDQITKVFLKAPKNYGYLFFDERLEVQ